MKQHRLLLILFLVTLLFVPLSGARAEAAPVVRAVLFYSPSCAHCQYVISETILPMLEKYGEQLQVLGLDVTNPAAQPLFLAALDKFGLEGGGVPFLVFDDQYLIGSIDIPEQFPGLVETYLAQGGLDWPDIPGLAETMNATQSTPQPTPSPVPIVRAVLFYRSACSHCQKLTQEVIPPLVEKYGAQLEIFGIDVSSEEGDVIYDAAIERFKIEQFGVPTLILGDQVLVGGGEIQEKFAGLIEEYFSQGGMDWPDIPGLRETILKAAETQVPTATAPTQSGTLRTTPVPDTVPSIEDHPNLSPGLDPTDEHNTDWTQKFASDPAGNSLAVIVLAGMLTASIWTVYLFRKGRGISVRGSWSRIIPVLCVAGLGVAGYLAYVETTQATAVCGPVGDCNTVQQSDYARLFGILPIGVLGMVGYIAIILAWFIGRGLRGQLADLVVLSLFAMTTFGTLFSIYLTFLEPFVIGATCAWCLTSSVLMTALMLLSVGPARYTMDKIGWTTKRGH